jgi:hypothetical protein
VRCVDELQSGRELLVRGVAAWADAGGNARVSLSGVFAEGVAGDASGSREGKADGMKKLQTEGKGSERTERESKERRGAYRIDPWAWFGAG